MTSRVIQGKQSGTRYVVSIVILVYEQELETILLTLAAALDQKKVDFEIIISDDGSQKVFCSECIEFMEKRGFKDYKFICHSENQGTVKNFRDAVNYAEGDYIKDFGPGDCFSSEESLYLWLKDIVCKGSKISFCDSVYYKKNHLEYESVIEVAHPQKPEIYLKSKALQKKYYLLYNDIFLGAALLVERKTLKEYISRIADKVKYAEDNVYRIMVLDGIECSYFSNSVIYYEWGDGISTQNNPEFKKMLKNDWNITTKYVCDRCRNNYIENMIRCYYGLPKDMNFLMRKVYEWLAFANIFFYNKQSGKNKRRTVQGDLTYLYKIAGDL